MQHTSQCVRSYKQESIILPVVIFGVRCRPRQNRSGCLPGTAHVNCLNVSIHEETNTFEELLFVLILNHNYHYTCSYLARCQQLGLLKAHNDTSYQMLHLLVRSRYLDAVMHVYQYLYKTKYIVRRTNKTTKI